MALITGATGAIGKAIARQIAASYAYEVVLACRDPSKAARAVREISAETGNPCVRYELVDLSRQDSIRALAERWRGPLHVLINNAAVTTRRRQETPEGIEVQFATNVLGYVWMMQEFAAALSLAASARVVNVSSYWAGGLDVDDLEFQRRTYSRRAAYRQAKQANRMLTAAFAERLGPLNIAVNACHPGDVNSTLSNSMGFGGQETPDEGARTPVWLALRESERIDTGKYFEHMREHPCRFSSNADTVEALYAACLAYSN